MPNPDPPLAKWMTELENAQLIRAAPDAEPAYLFKHTLTQDTVYGSLLKTTRSDLHKRVAGVLEQLWPDELDQNAALLELHYTQAAIFDKAFQYAVRAGDVAARAFAHAEALLFYDRALGLAQQLAHQPIGPAPEEVGRVFVQKGRVFEVMGDHPAALETYRAMIAFAQRIGDARIEADALNHLVTAQVVLGGGTPETSAQLERALALAQQVGNVELTARALWNRGLSARLDDPRRAAQDLEHALALSDAENLRPFGAFVRLDSALVQQVLGHSRESARYAEEALAQFRELDLKPMISDALATNAYLAYTRSEPDRARALASEGRAISQAIENPWGMVYNQLFCLSALDLEAGELTRVFDEGLVALARVRQLGHPFLMLTGYTILTRANLELRQDARAQALAAEASAAFGQDSPFGLWTRCLQAMVFLRRGELERAHALLAPLIERQEFPLTPFERYGWIAQTLAELALREERVAQGLALCDMLIRGFEQQDQTALAAGIYYWRARFNRVSGLAPQAGRDAAHACELLERAENRILLWRAQTLLAALLDEAGDAVAARDLRVQARACIQYITDHTPSELRADFLGADEVRRALAAPAEGAPGL